MARMFKKVCFREEVTYCGAASISNLVSLLLLHGGGSLFTAVPLMV